MGVELDSDALECTSIRKEIEISRESHMTGMKRDLGATR